MHILVKIPTRSRPKEFLKMLDSFRSRESKIHKITYLISIDDDDALMHNDVVHESMKEILKDDGIIVSAPRAGKIGSVNRDMEYAPSDYEILMQPADDWEAKVRGWDKFIVEEMKYFPDLDGVPWFFDGHQPKIDTLSIMGRTYYERFNYIYYPEYRTFWADNEFTEVADLLEKLIFVPNVLFEHIHPDWIYSHGYDGQLRGYDQLYIENNKQEDKDWDEELFAKRKANNFGLKLS